MTYRGVSLVGMVIVARGSWHWRGLDEQVAPGKSPPHLRCPGWLIAFLLVVASIGSTEGRDSCWRLRTRACIKWNQPISHTQKTKYLLYTLSPTTCTWQQPLARHYPLRLRRPTRPDLEGEMLGKLEAKPDLVRPLKLQLYKGRDLLPIQLGWSPGKRKEWPAVRNFGVLEDSVSFAREEEGELSWAFWCAGWIM